MQAFLCWSRSRADAWDSFHDPGVGLFFCQNNVFAFLLEQESRKTFPHYILHLNTGRQVNPCPCRSDCGEKVVFFLWFWLCHWNKRKIVDFTLTFYFLYIRKSPGRTLPRLPDLLQHPHVDRVHWLCHLGKESHPTKTKFCVLTLLKLTIRKGAIVMTTFSWTGLHWPCCVLCALPEMEASWMGSAYQV